MSGDDSSRTQNHGLANLVRAVFAAWRAEGITFLVLRNYEGLPESTGHDIDLLVKREQLARAEKLLVAAARRCGYHLHNRAEFAPVSLYFHHPESRRQIQFDLFRSLKWRGFALLSERAVLDWRVEGELFAHPHPVHEAINSLLSRQIYHGYVKTNYRPLILATARCCAQEMETALRRMFGQRVGKRLMAAILGERWDEAEAQTRAMRTRLVLRRVVFQPFATARFIGEDWLRFLRRLLRPPGLTVVLLGADGSGKSSVATRLTEALENTFPPDKGLRIHWKPALFLRRRRAERPPTTDPHGQTPRAFPLSMCVLLYHWLEFLLGAFLQFLPVRFRNGMVLVDRFHYDFVVDPRRYRLRVPAGLVRQLFRLIPAPDLVLLLDAPPEVLHARKSEVLLEETRRQREAYRELAVSLPNARVIDAAQPLDAVVAAATSHVLNHLEARLAGRLGSS